MVADTFLSFVEQYWQGMVSVLALVVAIYAWLVARRTFRMEYEVREVRVDFVADQVRVSSDNAGQNWEVQLFNDTGTSQLVRDLWIRVADFPADISDEQADRLATIMQAFTDATQGLMSRPEVYQSIRGLSRKPEFARHWFPRLVAKLLNVYDKVMKGRVETTGADRYLLFALNRMFFDLSALSSALTKPSRVDFGRYLFWRGFSDTIRQQDPFPVAKTVDIAIPPRGLRSAGVELRTLYAAFEKSLWILGGEFTLTCLLEARVSGAAYRSESDLIDVTLAIPTIDLRPFVDQIRKEAAGMKWPPGAG